MSTSRSDRRGLLLGGGPCIACLALCRDLATDMRVRKAGFVLAIFLIAVQSIAPLFGDGQRFFAPAFYDPGSVRDDSPKLQVFPLGSEPFTVALPFQLGKPAASPDGTVLYAPRFFDPSGPNTGLYKIEFGPLRATRLHGSEGLTSVYGIAASSTKIVVSAGYLTNGLVSRCGLYELMLSSGDVHQILGNSDCEYLSSWYSIGLSPDSRRIIAVRKHRLELIDTETGAVQSLGDGFNYAAWSPDGRWIAALDDQGEHTVLIDAFTFIKRRTLPPSEVIWSPDSHAILASGPHVHCPLDFGTLELIDIESGKRSIIRSSTCRISMLVFGWINVASRR